jgi:Uma2 family endonuclease
LVVEVADTSHADDRARRTLYGASGVARYWIANIGAGRIEAYADPGGAGYGTRVDHGAGSEIRLELAADRVLRFRVDDLLIGGQDSD